MDMTDAIGAEVAAADVAAGALLKLKAPVAEPARASIVRARSNVLTCAFACNAQIVKCKVRWPKGVRWRMSCRVCKLQAISIKGERLQSIPSRSACGAQAALPQYGHVIEGKAADGCVSGLLSKEVDQLSEQFPMQ